VRNFPQVDHQRCSSCRDSEPTRASRFGLFFAPEPKSLRSEEGGCDALLIRMLAARELSIPTRHVRLRPIALPVEHGGWSLLLEPILLGLLLAPSIAGLCLSLGALSAFLLRHPLKLALRDLRHRRLTTRTRFIHCFAFVYATSAILFFTVMVKLGGSKSVTPLLIATPMVFLQLSFDFSGRSRALIAELAGSIAAGSLATSLAVNAGWSLKNGSILWILVIARSVPTILYLRTRVYMLHGKSVSATPAIFAHVIATIVVLSMIRMGVAPVLALIAMLILLVRALIGLSNLDRNPTAKKLGMREMMFGAITVLTVAFGFLLKV